MGRAMHSRPLDSSLSAGQPWQWRSHSPWSARAQNEITIAQAMPPASTPILAAFIRLAAMRGPCSEFHAPKRVIVADLGDDGLRRRHVGLAAGRIAGLGLRHAADIQRGRAVRREL